MTDHSAFFLYVNEEASLLKENLSEVTKERLIDASIPLVSDGQKKMASGFFSNWGPEDVFEREWYLTYNEMMKEEKPSLNFDQNGLLKNEGSELNIHYQLDQYFIKHYPKDLNTSNEGEGLRLYEYLVSEELGEDAFKCMSHQQKQEYIRQKKEQNAKKAFSDLNGMLNEDDTLGRPFNMAELLDEDPVENVTLVNVSHPDAALTCLEAWLHIYETEGLIRFNHYLISEDDMPLT